MKQNWRKILHQLDGNIMQYSHITVSVLEQTVIAEYIKSHQGVLITEWVISDQAPHETYWYVLYLLKSRWICIQSSLSAKRPALSDLSPFFPVANRLQRAIYDLTKISTRKSKDKRPWLSHGHFITGLLNSNTKSNHYANTHYHFCKVSGEGVHEVPVGPVHAGIIEPGHFRFSVVGERILKLETRLGYTHKGIHHLLIGKSLQEACQLIGRISGDTTVAYSYAFALACENQLGVRIDDHTAITRAVLLECERLINHIGDIGAIINDTGFTSLATQFSILKEIFVRENVVLTGHRYMMDVIVPNQMMDQWSNATTNQLLMQLDITTSELVTLQKICQQHHGLQDRLQKTGIITQTIAESLGLLGVTAKSSGKMLDSRLSHLNFPYSAINFLPITETMGDVAARVNVRFRETHQSIEIIKLLLTKRQQLNVQSYSGTVQSLFGIGCVEGWRGPVCVAVKLTPDYRIAWCHFHDPSWQNWLALEYAIIDNIIADFPLINKSFNLSYSGQDS